jgi:hypothetical protein
MRGFPFPGPNNKPVICSISRIPSNDAVRMIVANERCHLIAPCPNPWIEERNERVLKSGVGGSLTLTRIVQSHNGNCRQGLEDTTDLKTHSPRKNITEPFKALSRPSMTQSNAPDTGFLFITDFVEISGKVIVSPQLET